MLPKVIMTFLIAVFPIVVSTVQGISSVETFVHNRLSSSFPGSMTLPESPPANAVARPERSNAPFFSEPA